MMRWFRRQQPNVALGTYGPLQLRTLKLRVAEALCHWHVIGKSGFGKSYFLARLFVDLLKAGFSATFLDPHGDTAQMILALLIQEGMYNNPTAFERILYLDLPHAARRGLYLPMNVLAPSPARQSLHEAAGAVVAAMKRVWPQLDGGAAPAFEQIVLSGCHVLAQHQLPLTLLHDLLVNDAWRKTLLERVTDPVVRHFFRDEYDRWDSQERTRLRGSTLRRVFLLRYQPVLRFSLGQTTNLLDYRAILDQGRSLIINLAINDAESRSLLGCLLTVQAEQGALSRADLPVGERGQPHFLAIDEFGDFVEQSGKALSKMLSATRKFGLFAIASHQDWDQTPRDLQGAMQNMGLEVVFRLGRADAEHSARILGAVDPLEIKHVVENAQMEERTHPVFSPLPDQWERQVQQIQQLAKRHALIKTPDDSLHEITTLPVAALTVLPERLAQIEETYLQRYFRSQPLIEQTVAAPSVAPPPVTTTRLKRLSFYEAA